MQEKNKQNISEVLERNQNVQTLLIKSKQILLNQYKGIDNLEKALHAGHQDRVDKYLSMVDLIPDETSALVSCLLNSKDDILESANHQDFDFTGKEVAKMIIEKFELEESK